MSGESCLNRLFALQEKFTVSKWYCVKSMEGEDEVIDRGLCLSEGPVNGCMVLNMVDFGRSEAVPVASVFEIVNYEEVASVPYQVSHLCHLLSSLSRRRFNSVSFLEGYRGSRSGCHQCRLLL